MTTASDLSASSISIQAGERSELGFAIVKLIWAINGNVSLPLLMEHERNVEGKARKLVREEMVRCNVMADRTND